MYFQMYMGNIFNSSVFYQCNAEGSAYLPFAILPPCFNNRGIDWNCYSILFGHICIAKGSICQKVHIVMEAPSAHQNGVRFSYPAALQSYFLSFIMEMPAQANPTPSIIMPDFTSTASRIVNTVTAMPIAIATPFSAVSTISETLLLG